jgi:hypothetical protein
MRQGAGRSLAPPGQGNTPAGDSSTLDVADLEETEDGFKIIICRSKTDQEGHGETIAIPRGVTTAARCLAPTLMSSPRVRIPMAATIGRIPGWGNPGRSDLPLWATLIAFSPR